MWLQQGLLGTEGVFSPGAELQRPAVNTVRPPTFSPVHRDSVLVPGVGFHQDHPVALVVVDHVVLHGDGRHHVQLISKVLHTRTCTHTAFNNNNKNQEDSRTLEGCIHDPTES